MHKAAFIILLVVNVPHSFFYFLTNKKKTQALEMPSNRRGPAASAACVAVCVCESACVRTVKGLIYCGK